MQLPTQIASEILTAHVATTVINVMAQGTTVMHAMNQNINIATNTIGTVVMIAITSMSLSMPLSMSLSMSLKFRLIITLATILRLVIQLLSMRINHCLKQEVSRKLSFAITLFVVETTSLKSPASGWNPLRMKMELSLIEPLQDIQE